MSFVAATIAQLLHAALMLAAAPLVAGLWRSADAILAGRADPPLSQEWRDLIRLFRKPATLAESASAVSRMAPLAAFAATGTAALLVPSFTLGMAFAPLNDLLVVGGLLTLARAVLAMAALDPGTGLPAVAAARTAALGCLGEPVLFLVVLALGLLGGTTNLDLLIGLQLQGMLQPIAAVAITASSLLLLALAMPDTAPLTREFSGADLALAEMTEALRLLVWVDLILGLFLPFGMAEPEAGVLGWIVGLLAWAVRSVVAIALLAALRGTLGHLPARRMPHVLGVSVALALLAALLVLASAVSA